MNFSLNAPGLQSASVLNAPEGKRLMLFCVSVKAFLSVTQSHFLFLRVAHRNQDKGAGAGAPEKAGRCVLLRERLFPSLDLA